MSTKHCLRFLILSVSVTGAAVSQLISAPEPQTGTIIGTVTDGNGTPTASKAIPRCSQTTAGLKRFLSIFSNLILDSG